MVKGVRTEIERERESKFSLNESKCESVYDVCLCWLKTRTSLDVCKSVVVV